MDQPSSTKFELQEYAGPWGGAHEWEPALCLESMALFPPFSIYYLHSWKRTFPNLKKKKMILFKGKKHSIEIEIIIWIIYD